jgi:hypothetical protein
MPEDVEPSILMPCPSEAETLGTRIHGAQSGIANAGVRGGVPITEVVGARIKRVEANASGTPVR